MVSGIEIMSHTAGGNYSQDLRFWAHHYSGGTGGAPRMTIRYNGNVGIGTTSPNYPLEVGTGINNTFSGTYSTFMFNDASAF